MGSPTCTTIKVASLDTETGGLRAYENTGLISIGICPPRDSKAEPLVVIVIYNENLFYDSSALRVNGFSPIENISTNQWAWLIKTPKTGEREIIEGVNEKEALDLIFNYIDTHFEGAMIAGCNIVLDKAFLEAA